MDEITTAKFLGIIYNTKIPNAKKWLRDCIRGVVIGRGRLNWQNYCARPLGPGVATFWVMAASAAATREIVNTENCQALIDSAIKFREEIRQKAKKLNYEVDPSAMRDIIISRRPYTRA